MWFLPEQFYLFYSLISKPYTVKNVQLNFFLSPPHTPAVASNLDPFPSVYSPYGLIVSMIELW